MREFLKHFRIGVHYGYPACCVFHYCWTRTFDGGYAAKKRGIIDLGLRPSGETRRWVPCYFHRNHPKQRSTNSGYIRN